MSDSTSQEPTMEEILASIRRIISEDDAPAAETEEQPAAVAEPEPPLVYNEPEPEPASEAQPEPVAEAQPEPAAEEEDDVLDLTEPVAQACSSDFAWALAGAGMAAEASSSALLISICID